MSNNELKHFRTKGSKNGVRLYQYPNGKLTPLGRLRYAKMYGRDTNEMDAEISRKNKVNKAKVSEMRADTKRKNQTNNAKTFESIAETLRKNKVNKAKVSEMEADTKRKDNKSKAEVDKILAKIEDDKKVNKAKVQEMEAETGRKNKVNDAKVQEMEAETGRKNKVNDAKVREMDADTGRKDKVNDAKVREMEADTQRKNKKNDADIESNKNINKAKVSEMEADTQRKNKRSDAEVDEIRADTERKNKSSDIDNRKKTAEAESVEFRTKKEKEEYAEKLRVAKIQQDVDRWNNADRIASTTSATALNADKVNMTIGKIKNKKQTTQEMTSMDNKQLRERIERLKLEQQYSNLTSNRVSRGHEIVSNVLTVAGTTAATAGTILQIAALFKSLKK